MHTKHVAGVKPSHPTRAIQDANPAGARKAIDSLVISFTSEDPALTVWDDTCKDCKLNSRSLIVSAQSGATTEDKIAALAQTITSLVEEGLIDLSTQVMVTGHGASSDSLGFVFEDEGSCATRAVPFLQLLRQALAGGPNRGDWGGTIHVGACQCKQLSEYAESAAGYTALHSGNKSVLQEDIMASYAAVLRSLSTEVRTESGLLPVQVRRLWDSACEKTGENIFLCGNGESFHHKVVDYDFDLKPNPEKQKAAIFAKLIHGSVLSLEKVLGKNPEEALRRCQEPELTPLAQLVTGKGIRDQKAKIELLLEMKQDIDAPLRKGRTALYYALLHGSPGAMRTTVKTLLERGANPWIRTTDQATGWQLAPVIVLDLFMTDPAGTAARPAPWPDSVNPTSRRSPLHAACARGDTEWMEQHPHSAKELESEDEYGNTPLAVALIHQQYAVANSLLLRQVDADVRLSNNDTLLGHAVTHGDITAVKMLLKHGVDILACDDIGMPLVLRAMQAVKAGRATLELLELLLKTAAGQRSVQRDCLLHYACHLGDAKLLRALLEHGLDPLEADFDGLTPIDLMQAASKTRPAVFEVGQRMGLY